MVSSLRSGRNVTFRILDVDWCTSDKVILASDDGCVRVLEMSMKSACFRMDEQELTGTGPNGRRSESVCILPKGLSPGGRAASAPQPRLSQAPEPGRFCCCGAGLSPLPMVVRPSSVWASALSLTLFGVLFRKIEEVYVHKDGLLRI